MDELERWTTAAPEAFLQAKAAHAELGPDSAQLESMLDHLERALSAPAPAADTPASAAPGVARTKLGLWLVSAVTLLLGGVYLATRSAAPLTAPPAHEQPAPVAPPSAPVVNVPAPVAPSPAAAQREPAAEAKPSARTPAAPGQAPDPAAELALLERARRMLAADPARTLALTDEHRRTFRPGLFAEERELLAIDALVGLDRRDTAERRARAFTRSHPNSVHAHRLNTILQRTTP